MQGFDSAIIQKDMFTNQQLRLMGRFLFLVLAYSLLRIGFYFYHLEIYKQFTQDEVFLSLFLGVRFDVAAVCLLNAPVILLGMIPGVSERTERFSFIFLNALGFLASIDDYELFSFVGKRLGLDFFVISDDILVQLPQLAFHYWYLPGVALLFTVGFYFLDLKVFHFQQERRPRPWVRGVTSGLILGLTFMGIRGGLQHKSINIQTAFVQGKNELGHLVLNTPYHFLRTLKNQRVDRVSYFKQDKEEKNLILNHRDFRGDYKGQKGANVVLIVLESFALEYMEEGYAPFLSELKHRSLFFGRHLANGRRSIESLPSLLCGLPQLIDEPISKSAFGGNKFVCFPEELKKQGYTSHFYHGGARGTMGFEAFTRASGFERYFAREDYPGTKDFDGTWGIFDGPYLEYVASELDKMKRPFLAGIFTLSSHQPYRIPDGLKGKFPKGKLDIHESIGYTDFALKEFFDAVKDRPWFNNTLFILTADHSQKLETKKFQNLVGSYRVPLLLYAPGHNWSKGSGSKVSHHSDIPDTVLDFLEVTGEEMAATGRSVLSDDSGIALNYADGAMYFMVRGDQVTTLTKDGIQNEGGYDWESGQEGTQKPSQDPLLKAYLQYFVNGLIDNNLSLYR